MSKDSLQRSVAKFILGKAAEIVTTERGNQHGSAEDSFQMIADMWGAYIVNSIVARNPSLKPEAVGYLRSIIKVHPVDVAHMMTNLKQARSLFGMADKDDHYIDGAGYLSLAAGLAGVVLPGTNSVEDGVKAALAGLNPAKMAPYTEHPTPTTGPMVTTSDTKKMGDK